jgi:tyramine---L-glutamate ligase
MTRVLVSEFLCGGGWVEPARATGWAPALLGEAWAMLAAVAADFAAIPDVAVISLLDARLNDRALDPRVEVIHVEPGGEARAFRAIVANVDHALVIAPEIDGILHERCTWAAAAGATLLGPAPEIVALTSDKLALARHWLAAGIPTPLTVPRTDESPAFPPPWIVKPRFGMGSIGIHVSNPRLHPCSHEAGREANFLLHSPGFAGVEMGVRGREIIQPLIPGRAASVAFLIGPKQIMPLPPCWQHLDDRFQYLGGSTPIPTDLSVRAVSIARRAIEVVPGLHGYVGVDVVLGDEDMAIEINPRLTTSYIGLRQLAQSNLADALLRIVRGERVALRWADARVNFRAHP